MSYLGEFDKEFMKHTLQIIENYRGDFDATLLVNCLLGLLVVPKENYLMAIPESPLDELPTWGIQPQSIKSAGKPYNGNPNPETLRGLVISLRHAVAHFRITPIPEGSKVHSFRYRNRNGLHAEIPLKEMKEFTKRLAKHLEQS